MKHNKLIAISLLASMFIVAMVLPTAVQASSGSGVSPGILSTTVERGKSVQLEITVFNYESYPVEYDVYVDEAPYSSWVTFDSPTFTLAAGEVKKVKMTINAPADGGDSNTFYVRVLPTPTETEGTPLIVAYQIPTTVGLTGSVGPDDVKEGPETNLLVWLALPIIAVVIIAGYFVYRSKMKGRTKGKE